MEFRAKILDLEAFGKLIVVLGVEDAKRLGIMSSDRVRLTTDGSEIVAILNTASEFHEGALGVFKEVRSKLGLREGDKVRARPADRPESLSSIRAKIMGEKLVPSQMETIVKDDENLSSQAFNPFEDRVTETLEMGDRAEEETGERKAYMVNVSAETEEMLRRAEYVKEQGGTYVMVDIITCGFSSLQTLRKHDLGLVIHGHRAGHAAFTRMVDHGISMKVIAKVARMIGVDQLHVGAAVGKMSEAKEEVLENVDVLERQMYGLKRVLPVASGGLHPGLVPELMHIFGHDVVIQAGGGIHGHPMGSRVGAVAMKQAVTAVMGGRTLKDFARDHEELAAALRTWSGG